jgi:hypothetical protein
MGTVENSGNAHQERCQHGGWLDAQSRFRKIVNVGKEPKGRMPLITLNGALDEIRHF